MTKQFSASSNQPLDIDFERQPESRTNAFVGDDRIFIVARKDPNG